VVRLMYAGKTTLKCEEQLFRDAPLFADPSFFNFFSFPLIEGDSASCLQGPHAVVLSAKTAEKYFGSRSVRGRRLSIMLGEQFTELTVTGVAEDIPDNSSITFDVLLPLQAHPGYAQRADSWNDYCCATYVQIGGRGAAGDLERGSVALMDRHYREKIERYYEGSEQAVPVDPPSVGLQRLEAMHLNPISNAGITTSGRPIGPYALGGIALLILAIACINFTTLATGRASGRAAEIGARKALGGTRWALIKQFLGETVVLSFLALFLGLVLAELALPSFNELAGRNLSLQVTDDIGLVVFLIGLALVVGVGAGAYPALVMSRFTAVEALARKPVMRGKNVLLRTLVLTQFTMTVFLILATVVISRQLDFVISKDMGFDHEALVSIPIVQVPAAERDRFFTRYREELLRHDNTLQVTAVDVPFKGQGSRVSWSAGADQGNAYIYRVDYNYLRTVGIDVVAGRDFSRDRPGDATGAVIVNETLVREFNLESPVGKPLAGIGRASMGLAADPVIIGVVKDYHFLSLRDSIKPAVLHVNPKYPLWNVLVRPAPGNVAGSLALLRTVWEEILPDVPFEYSFTDEDLRRLYAPEYRWRTLARYSSLVAIGIAGLGLFGLSALAAVRRTKEMGIRKVLGASAAEILLLLNREFILMVGVANLAAWPVAYLVMRRWLADFAYREPVGITPFILVGLSTVMIALIAVSYQAIRAALANPVAALKYE